MRHEKLEFIPEHIELIAAKRCERIRVKNTLAKDRRVPRHASVEHIRETGQHVVYGLFLENLQS